MDILIDIKEIYNDLGHKTHITTWFYRLADKLKLKENIDYEIKYTTNKFYRAKIYVSVSAANKIYTHFNFDKQINTYKFHHSYINFNTFGSTPNPKLTDDTIIYDNHGKSINIDTNTHINHSTTNKIINEMIEEDKKNIKIKELSKDNKLLKEEVNRMNNILNNMYSSMIDLNELNKLNNKDKHINIKDTDDIIPCIMFSDLHYGKIVTKSYVFGKNEYNMEIADIRLQKAISLFIDYYKNKLNYKYKEIIIVLGGDSIESSLHITESNVPIVEQVLSASNSIIKALNTIKQAFPNTHLRIVGVVGNHGRQISPNTGKYMPTFNILKSSYEYLIFNNIINAGYHIEVDDTNEVLFKVFDTNVLLLHGYEVKLSTKNPNSIMNSLRNKFKQFTSFSENTPDIFLLNHFHKPFNFDDKVIIGGSIVGYDDYSKSLGFEYYHPCMTTFCFCNSKNSKIMHYKLLEV